MTLQEEITKLMPPGIKFEFKDANYSQYHHHAGDMYIDAYKEVPCLFVYHTFSSRITDYGKYEKKAIDKLMKDPYHITICINLQFWGAVQAESISVDRPYPHLHTLNAAYHGTYCLRTKFLYTEDYHNPSVSVTTKAKHIVNWIMLTLAVVPIANLDSVHTEFDYYARVQGVEIVR